MHPAFFWGQFSIIFQQNPFFEEKRYEIRNEKSKKKE